MKDFASIDAARRERGLTVCGLCRRANVPVSTYWRVATGRKAKWRAGTLKKLQAALVVGRAIGRADTPDLVAATYRAAVHALCKELGADPEKVLAADPGQRATASPEWAEAARVRALTVACVITALGLPAARVAAAIGVTRAAASDMLHRAEDLWENDPALEALVKRVGKSVGGEDIAW